MQKSFVFSMIAASALMLAGGVWSLVPAHASAPVETALSVSFCDLPLVAVCSDTIRPARARERLKVRDDIRDAAARTTYAAHESDFVDAKISLDQLRRRGLEAIVTLIMREPLVYASITHTYIRVTYAQMMQRTFFEEALVPLALEKIRTHMLSAVRARSGHLNRWIRLAMEHRIESATFVHASLLPLTSKMGVESSKVLLNSFRDICGIDGMNDNAFAQLVGGQPYVVLCPGKLHSAIGAATEGRDLRRVFWSLFRTLAHELAHHIDWNGFAPVYWSFQSCISTHHSARIGVDPKRVDALLKLIIDAGGAPARITRDLLATSHKMREISADYWAAEALADYLDSPEGRALSEEDRMTVLRDSASSACVSQEGSHHPSGAFRVDVLLRQNPAMAAAMGCPSAELFSRPGCDLQGER